MFARTRRLVTIAKESTRFGATGALLGAVLGSMDRSSKKEIVSILPVLLEGNSTVQKIVANSPALVRILAALIPDTSDSGPRCYDCDEAWGHGYIVTDELWEQAIEEADGGETEIDYLCLPCLQARLGEKRPIAISDFTDVPINVSIRWAIHNVVRDDTH